MLTTAASDVSNAAVAAAVTSTLTSHVAVTSRQHGVVQAGAVEQQTVRHVLRISSINNLCLKSPMPWSYELHPVRRLIMRLSQQAHVILHAVR